MSSLLAVAGDAAAEPGRFRRPELPPTNEFGAPVRTPGGAPLTYERDEIEAQAALGAPPARPAEAPSPDAAAEAPSLLRTYASFGSGIGLSGLATAAVGGRTEIYAGSSFSSFGGNGYWYALARDAATGNY
ncbi:MAG TPA: hypothetical protein VFS00_28820, partial [Polyangiaceae bacterium]|nr:hypothetical protein [Polyangiaceae bacterium]